MAKEYIVTKVDNGYSVNEYLVKMVGSKITSCSCIGYRYNHKCKHIDLVNATLQSEMLAPAEESIRFSRRFCEGMIDFFNFNYFKPNTVQFEVAGSYRRESPDSKDLDIIILGNNPKIKQSLLHFLETSFPEGNAKKVTDVNAKSLGNYIIQWYVPMTEDHSIMMDFHLVAPEDFESELLFFTGSMKHNVKMRAKAKRMGYKLNQYGLWNGEECLTKQERKIFELIGMGYIPPKER